MTLRDIAELYEDYTTGDNIIIYQRLVNYTEVCVSNFEELLKVNYTAETEFVYTFRFRDNRLEVVI